MAQYRERHKKATLRLAEVAAVWLFEKDTEAVVYFFFCLKFFCSVFCLSYKSVGEASLAGFDECNYAITSAAGVNSLHSR